MIIGKFSDHFFFKKITDRYIDIGDQVAVITSLATRNELTRMLACVSTRQACVLFCFLSY